MAGSPLSPEAARWLAIPLQRGVRVVVAGVAGGVGTTTVAAALWWALDQYRDGGAAVDRGDGSLVARLPHEPGDRAGQHSREADLTVHDLGACALTVLAGVLDDPDQVVVVVCGAHDAGLVAARQALVSPTTRRETCGTGRRRTVVVPVAVAGPSRPGAALRARALDLGLECVIVPLGRSRALAAGGRLPVDLAPGVQRAAVVLAVEVVRCARWVAAVAPDAAPFPR